MTLSLTKNKWDQLLYCFAIDKVTRLKVLD